MKQIILQNKIVPYSVRSSTKAKNLSIAVHADSRVVVTLPRQFDQLAAEKFIHKKLNWVLKSLLYFERRGNIKSVKLNRHDYQAKKEQALLLAKIKVAHWSRVCNIPYNRVSIKNQKTRWGSCSKKGNLNFNYKIIHLPEYLVDYLVVHELCHLQEFNHSRNFWQLVALACPDHKRLRQELKAIVVR